MAETAGSEAACGEARMRVEGGFAHLPGRARECAIPLATLPPPDRAELARLADAAAFFDCEPAPTQPRPDARTYTIALTLDGRTRELQVAEPIRDPALAELVATLRRITRERG
ncbi:protealysin inhibitor emfourin [Sphingomonas sp. DT-51]|uniref:protealysin inhibitor emfourin n=1 Tax=Sphingomonas sp. DT-51 TaxID=3396165 RepID=UPI003F1C602D